MLDASLTIQTDLHTRSRSGPGVVFQIPSRRVLPDERSLKNNYSLCTVYDFDHLCQIAAQPLLDVWLNAASFRP